MGFGPLCRLFIVGRQRATDQRVACCFESECNNSDAAQTPERPFKWFVDNSVAGPFMNGRDGVGFDVNCDLERTSAWQDGAGGVWFVLRANRDIAEGEWLMWKYNWTAGAGIPTPGLTFAFD